MAIRIERVYKIEWILSIIESDWDTLYQTGGFGTTTQLSKSDFNRIYQESSGVMHRECLDCVSTHENIYYVRKTNFDSFDAYSIFLESWLSTPANMMGTDFKLYSSLIDALADTNAWTFCNYAVSNGFPRDCGPSG